MRNPQLFQQIQNFQKNQNDPQEIINNMLKGYKPEQIKAFRQYASGLGITNEQLDKYGINVK